MSRVIKFLMVVGLVLLISGPVWSQQPIHVKEGGSGDGSSWANALGTLQDALDLAVSGDRIWVATGTYIPTSDHGLKIGDRGKHFQMIDGVRIFGGFPDTGDPVWDDRDPELYETILSGDLLGNDVEVDHPSYLLASPYRTDNCYHVFFHGDVSPDSNAILNGFTITGGNASDSTYPHYYGGGMFNIGGSHLVMNCVFKNNSAETSGGGMFNESVNPTISNCTFSANAANSSGGGLFNRDSDSGGTEVSHCTFSGNWAGSGAGISTFYEDNLTVIHCSFSSNSASSSYGGGMKNNQSSPIVQYCTFDNNSAYSQGGGMYNYDSFPTVSNCVFTCNSVVDFTYASGGGMYNDISDPTVNHCIFSGNLALEKGGGMYNEDSNPTLTNCVFSGNSTDQIGGGICNEGSDPTLINCTFSGNSSDDYGGGLYNYDNSDPRLKNCILWGNIAADGPQIYNEDSSSTSTITYSDVEGGWSGVGNIDAYPLFIDADGADDIFGTEDDNLRLGPGSPCIDAAQNSAVPTDINIDLDGGPRFIDDRTIVNTGDGISPFVDMGAYECLTLYVNSTASGSNNGRSWHNAFLLLQDALDLAIAGDQIWVAEGTYYPTTEVGSTGDRYQAFQMVNSAAIYGGFPDTGDPGWDERDPDTYETILSGDIGTSDDSSDNCYHVFYHPSSTDLDTTAILDGFTITAGNADGLGDYNNGGGMSNFECSPTVTNCIFSGNTADYGGGMYNREYSRPKVSQCTFSGNEALYGGGIYSRNDSNSEVTNCSFRDNLSAINGGGMFNYYSNPIVINSIFNGNSADSSGGGISSDNSDPNLINCLFSGNSASVYGGGIENENSYPTLTNCTFSANSANYGGGIFNLYSDPTITNSILWGNSAFTSGPQIYNFSSTPIITYSDIQDEGLTSDGNIDDDPLFIDADGADNVFGTEDDDLRLSTGSPCTDAGDPAYVAESSETDLAGRDRIINGIVDMGVYEYGNIVVYVNSIAGGNNNGTSWENAFLSLQDGLDLAITGDELWVAQGTYYPTTEVGGTGDRYKTFQLINGVEIYGGFPNTGDPSQDERDPDTYETILSGDIGTPDDNSDNCYHVFYHPSGTNLDTTTILDGFTITAGNANGTGDEGKAGGICNLNDNSPTVSHCTFRDNSATSFGGGMYNGLCNPIVTYCTFQDNSVDYYGGGMYNHLCSPIVTYCTFQDNSAERGGGIFNSESNVMVTNCIFTNNSVSIYGGGMRNLASNPTLTNCIFVGNSAGDGGGMFNSDNSDPKLSNCVFSGNVAEDGGGIRNENSDPLIINCTFSANEATSGGGGMFNNNSNPTVANCILWGNTASSDPQISNGGTSTPSITYSDIQDEGLTSDGNIDEDPDFKDADGIDNIYGTEDDDLRLASGSPCIDAGDNTEVPPDAADLDSDGDTTERIPHDLDGKTRFIDDPTTTDTGQDDPPDYTVIVDMGAYEYSLVLLGDFNYDFNINTTDLSIMNNKWMAYCTAPSWCDSCDINRNGRVDLADYAILAAHWLIGTQ